MEFPYCQSSTITERPESTARGYRRFRCRACARGFNERTGSVFNRVHYPPDVVCLVVLWRVRYKLSLRDLAEMFLERGVVFTHEAVREWEAKLAPVLSDILRKQRRGKVGRSWYCDETYLKVKGRGVYLYRAIDRNGNLVDVLLSERQDQAAAEAFFRSARTVTDRDLALRVVAEGRAVAHTPAHAVMTPEVIYCFEDQTVDEAAQVMEQHQIRRLIVLNRHKRLVGIVALGDLATHRQSKKVAGEALSEISEAPGAAAAQPEPVHVR